MKSKSLLNFSQFGILFFFVLTIVAMVIFPGGTHYEPDLDSYSFLNNFFSDLGRTTDFNGNNNPSQYIFTSALVMVALAMFTFFIVSHSVFKTLFKRLNLATIFFGVIASLSYIGIAFTPWDTSLLGHEISVKVGFSAFCIMSVLLTIMIYRTPDYPNIYGHAFVLFDFILIAYILLLFWGPDPRADIESLTIQVIGQKIVVYAEIFCMLFQINGAKQYVNKKDSL